MTFSKWATQYDAALFLCMSERSLHRLRNDGTLIPGKCWRRKIPHNKNSHVLYNLEVCEAVLSGSTAAEQMEIDQLSKVENVEISET